MLDLGALNPVVSVQRVEGWGWSSVVGGSEGNRSDEDRGGGGEEGAESDSEEDGGAAGSVRDEEGIGAVGVTGAGGAAFEDEEEDTADRVGVDVDASEDAVIGGAPDTAEVLEGGRGPDVLELSGLGASDELKETVEAAAVAEDGGACGEPIGGFLRVDDKDDASVVPSGLSGSLVIVTQSVMDTVLLFASCIFGLSQSLVR